MFIFVGLVKTCIQNSTECDTDEFRYLLNILYEIWPFENLVEDFIAILFYLRARKYKHALCQNYSIIYSLQ